MSARTENVLLAAAAAAALFVRSVGLAGFEVTHWDEGLVWGGARFFASLGAEGHYSPTQAPPLVPLLLAPAAALGGGPRAALWIPALAGTLAVVVAGRLLRRLASPGAACAGAFLLALSGLQALYGRSLLTEAFYVLFLLTALSASARYVERPGRGRLAWVVAATVACQYTKYNGCLAGGPLVLWLLLEAARGRDRSRALAHAGALLGIVTLAMAANVLAIHLAGDLPYFLEHYSGYVAGSAVGPGGVLRVAALVVPWSVLALAAAGLGASLRRPAPAWVLVHLAFGLYLAFLFRYTFYLRLLAPVGALVVLCAARSLDLLAPLFARSRALGAAATATVLAAVLGESAWKAGRFVQADYGGTRAAVEWVRSQEDRAPVLLAAQRPLWPPLGREAAYGDLPSDEALRLAREAPQVLVVSDLHAHSRYGPRTAAAVLRELAPYAVARFPNRLGLDVLENNLTPDELARVLAGEEGAVPPFVFEVRVHRVPAEALREALSR